MTKLQNFIMNLKKRIFPLDIDTNTLIVYTII